MEPTNETGPSDGDKKIETENKQSFDEMYRTMLKRDQDQYDNELKAKATQDFESVRKLGFATQKEVSESVEKFFGKFAEELRKMREENTQLREWVMRAKAQGLNSGRLDDAKDKKLEVNPFSPAFI